MNEVGHGVSIVIPALNAAATLGAQLRALQTQTYHGQIEIVVADNGSSDGTREIVVTASQRDQRIRLIDATDAPRGGAAAKNRGVTSAVFPIVAFCDADDLVAPDWLAELVDRLDEADVVTARREYWLLNPRARGRYQREFGDRYQVGTAVGISGGAFAMNRADYLGVGGFDEAFAGAVDNEFSIRVHLAGLSVTHAERAVVHCRLPMTMSARFRRQRALTRSKATLTARYPDVVPPQRLDRSALLKRLLRAIARAPRCAWRRDYALWWAGNLGRLVGQYEAR